MKRLFLVFALPFLLADCGLNSNGESPPPDSGPMYPLTIGNTWVVVTSTYRFDGVILNTYTDSTTIVDTIRINGEKWYVRRFVRPGTPALVVNDTVTIRSDGFWTYISVVGGAHLYFKYPGSIGDVVRLDPLRIEIISNDLTQDFPIGLLQHCYDYHITYSNTTTSKYVILSPNIGFVKATTYDSIQTPPSVYVSQREDLQSYTVR